MSRTHDRNLFLGVLMLFLHAKLAAQGPVSKNYEVAQCFSSDALGKMVFDTRVTPHWLKSGNRFWYSYRTTKGSFYYLVNLDKKAKAYLFDPKEMAAKIKAITGQSFEYQDLPIRNAKFNSDETVFRFDINGTAPKKTYRLEYELKTGRLYEAAVQGITGANFTPGWLNVSPDSAFAVYVKGYNLYYMDRANYQAFVEGKKTDKLSEHQLTNDGIEDYGYVKSPELGAIEVKNRNMAELRQPVEIFWSPDSKRFAVVKKDRRNLKPLWVINSLASPRPVLQTYKYQMPGEPDSAEAELLIFSIETKKIDTIDVKKFANQTLKIQSRIVKGKASARNEANTWLSKKSDELYFSRQSRDLQRYEFCVADLQTGKIRILISENASTYLEANDPIMINGGKEFVHLSERDGWAHFYLYDNNGALKKQITSGSWHCNYEGYRVDEKNRVLYFIANGREKNEDPYYKHLYRVNLDGTGLRLLNQGNFDHSVELNENASFFIDNYSRANTIPKAVVRNMEGKLVLTLDSADLSGLFAKGYRFPEPFRVKAADNRTDLYGVMYKPFNFDSSKKYPIIEYVYPGPQTEAVEKSFSINMNNTDRMAQLGCIVISIGNRGGSPSRSKSYQDYGYGNFRDYGLADKKYAVEQLGKKFNFIDTSRVGIFGHSGGGFMSAAAILQYPDFYKVAIAASGNHDNNIYNSQFTERYNGVKEVVDKEGKTSFLFNVKTTPQLASQLKGHLLLITGDVDNNVHPAHTFRMADALINTNKRFDMFILPGQAHYYRTKEYVFWLYADYFTKYLLKTEAFNADITRPGNELNNHK